MRSVICLPLGVFFILFSSAQAFSLTIDDATDLGIGYTLDSSEMYRGTTDFLGDEYDTAGIDVSFAGSMITIDLYTKYDGTGSADPIALPLADLFFDTGSGWNYAIDMGEFANGGMGLLYSVDSALTSEDILQNKTSGNWMYGRYYAGSSVADPSPIVAMESGTAILGSSVAFSMGESTDSRYDDYNIYSMAFDTTSLGLVGGETLGIHWATAYCANDVVIGSVTAPVPEPATMLLFGTGLVGLAGVRLRKKK